MNGVVAIADASPHIAFASIGQLDLFGQLFEEVVIPQVVLEEITPSIPALPTWITVDPRLLAHRERELDGSLDAGERAAIALAPEGPIKRLVIDDLNGRKIAQRNGIEIVGSFGLVVLARQLNLIPFAQPLLIDLVRAGLFVSRDLYEHTLSLVDEAIPD
ncbi:MAG: hypothetical protein ACKOWF_03510, partial [Chloroflexota bacterium]